MRKQLVGVALCMLLFAGLGSSTLLAHALARSNVRSTYKHLGPHPTPHWYWRWASWRLGEGYAKGHPIQPSLRPHRAPQRIPLWAWRRLHLFLSQRKLAATNDHGHRPHATTTTTTTTTSATTTTAAATGRQFYVSPTGSDSADGSLAHPWATIQHAVDSVPTGAVVILEPGTYAPFTITTPDVTVTSAGGAAVKGTATAQDVVRIAADGDTVSNFTVSGCVPNSSPSGSFENNGSSGVRINDNTSGVTVSRMTVSESYGTNSAGLPFGCYGIFAHYASQATITGNNIYRNGLGIFIRGAGSGDLISNNQVHDNQVPIRNTISPTRDDYGAIGIGFDLTAGPVAERNMIYNNYGPSHDYGTDGGGFEIYQSSNVTMRLNTLSNNDDILETGANRGGTCANNVFTQNTASGRTAGSTLGESVGLLLRCAQNMQVTGNTISNIDHWVYDITTGGNFGSSISGLAIENNTVTQGQKVYALQVDPSGLGITIDANRLNFTGRTFASLWNGTTVGALASWQGATGFDRSSASF
jgi:parallel beta-helix repeat protein